MKRSAGGRFYNLAGALAAIAIFSISAFGHCDTMDGPVVKAAQQALQTTNINHVLIWVHDKEEAEARQAFKEALKVRALGNAARGLADKYFFETVVRLHRAGEGEPYTGLKPAGGEGAELFFEIDKAIEKNSLAALAAKFPADERGEIEERFREVVARKKFDVNDVAAGRRFVESYVMFMHLVEKLEGHAAG